MRLLCVNVDVREISSVEAMLSDGRWVCSPDHVHHYWRESGNTLRALGRGKNRIFVVYRNLVGRQAFTTALLHERS